MTYAEIDALNWSTLKNLATSALLLRWRADHPRADTPALQLGRAIHCAVLEPERWAREYVRQPGFGDGRTKAAKDAKSAWLASLVPGVEVLRADDHALAERCAAAVRSHPSASHSLSGGSAEEILQWWDAETRIACKARIDYVRPDLIVDLKSTRQGTLRAMEHDCARYLYHGQLAWYHDAAIASGRIPAHAPPPHVVLVQAVEPFDVVAAVLSRDTLAAGRDLYRSLLARYEACAEADYWPGLAPDYVQLDLPTWADRGDEEEAETW